MYSRLLLAPSSDNNWKSKTINELEDVQFFFQFIIKNKISFCTIDCYWLRPSVRRPMAARFLRGRKGRIPIKKQEHFWSNQYKITIYLNGSCSSENIVVYSHYYGDVLWLGTIVWIQTLFCFLHYYLVFIRAHIVQKSM